MTLKVKVNYSELVKSQQGITIAIEEMPRGEDKKN
jgi:hypothetical protein